MTEAGAGGKGHKGLPWIIRGEEKRSDWFRVTVAPFSDSGSRSREAPPSEWAPARRYPRLAQRLPTNQRAPERDERLMDVGPLLIPHAQAAKLTEPREWAFHNPALPAQSTPMRGATHGEHGTMRRARSPRRIAVAS